MSWTHVRWAVTGMAIGLLIALAPSCGKKCGLDSCATGCCTTDNVCKTDDKDNCGTKGGACSTCTTTQVCVGGACAASGGGAGGGDGGGGGGGEIDAGPPDAGQPCTKDDECSKYQSGGRCDQSTNQCVPGDGCNVESDCQLDDPLSYCYRFGLQCRCVIEPGAPIGYQGTCHRRLAPCETCTNNSECGSDFVFDPQGICKELQGNSDGGKYCFQQKIGSCPCGTIDDGFGYCKPQNNTCANVGCAEDKNCPSGAVCNVGACLCEPRCRWDFDKKELAAPGCPPGKTCWVDDKNLDSTSLYFGAGRCRTPCTGEADCAKSATNAFGGPRLTCHAEQLSGGGMSDKRCRGNGQCMDDAECPVQPLEAIPLGYCDRKDLGCKVDCRPGNDPVTGTNYKDCRAPYACASDAGAADGGLINFCRLLTCLEQGGAQIACTRGEYCCGEDKDNDGGPDPCPPIADRKPDNCYTAPSPPFCTTCMSNDDCKNLQLPAYLSGANACSNGSRSPNCSPLPTLCINVGPKPGTMMPNINVCAPATFNDITVDAKGLRHDQKGCPAGYPPIDILPSFTMGDDFCNTDSDCNLGTDAGSCKVDLAQRLQDGGHAKDCQCVAGTGSPTSMCPNTPPLADGGLDPARITSECKSSVSGAIVQCVQSVVCLPNTAVLFVDAGAPKYGCGL